MKKAAELVFGPAHAKLITVPALGKMLPIDLENTEPTGDTKPDGCPWRLDDCGTAGESWSENCDLLLLKATFGANAFEYTKPKELSELVPNGKTNNVYLVNADLYPQSGGLIDEAEDDDDNNQMVLMCPGNNEAYCSYYYFPKMTKAASRHPDNAFYTNKLVPLAMVDQFHQDETGQIDGDGQKGRRFKKIHRAYVSPPRRSCDSYRIGPHGILARAPFQTIPTSRHRASAIYEFSSGRLFIPQRAL